MYIIYFFDYMDKRTLEITTSIASVLVLIILIIVSHLTLATHPSTIMESYGFIVSLIIFILSISVIGIKLLNVE